MNRFHHLQAWALVALGAWLLLSPFVVPGYRSGSPAVINTDVLGMAAFILGCVGFVHARSIDRTIAMALGIGEYGSPHHRR